VKASSKRGEGGAIRNKTMQPYTKIPRKSAESIEALQRPFLVVRGLVELVDVVEHVRNAFMHV